MGRLVFGVGINDSGRITKYCVYYKQWYELMRRCFSENYKNQFPTYEDVTSCKEWTVFTNFEKWMMSQPHNGCVLDKDILLKGNKVYSPETCAFVPEMINLVILTADSSRGLLPLGVTVDPRKGEGKKRFVARVGSGVRGRNLHLGMFRDEMSAHNAWQIAKASRIEYEVSAWSTQPSFRTDVADSLLARSWNLRLENSLGVETKSL